MNQPTSFEPHQQMLFTTYTYNHIMLYIFRCIISIHEVNTSTKYPSKPMSSSFNENCLKFCFWKCLHETYEKGWTVWMCCATLCQQFCFMNQPCNS